eukprot:1146434-Pyramimonas_sp.AAC.1
MRLVAALTRSGVRSAKGSSSAAAHRLPMLLFVVHDVREVVEHSVLDDEFLLNQGLVPNIAMQCSQRLWAVGHFLEAVEGRFDGPSL